MLHVSAVGEVRTRERKYEKFSDRMGSEGRAIGNTGEGALVEEVRKQGSKGGRCKEREVKEGKMRGGEVGNEGKGK